MPQYYIPILSKYFQKLCFMIDMIDIQFSKFNFHRFSQEENSKNHLFNCFTENFIQHFQNLQNEKLYFTRDAINNSLFKISNFTVSREKNLRRTLSKSCSIASIKKNVINTIKKDSQKFLYRHDWSIFQVIFKNPIFVREKFNETSRQNPLRSFLKNFFSISLRRERHAANIRRIGHVGGSPRWTKDGIRVQTFVRGRSYPSREFGYRPLETEADRSIPDNAQEKA